MFSHSLMFLHVTESQRNIKLFFKPKLKPNIFLLNWAPGSSRSGQLPPSLFPLSFLIVRSHLCGKRAKEAEGRREGRYEGKRTHFRFRSTGRSTSRRFCFASLIGSCVSYLSNQVKGHSFLCELQGGIKFFFQTVYLP